jgi:hypothetical protein
MRVCIYNTRHHIKSVCIYDFIVFWYFQVFAYLRYLSIDDEDVEWREWARCGGDAVVALVGPAWERVECWRVADGRAPLAVERVGSRAVRVTGEDGLDVAGFY